jgi:hypothetical protein
VGATFTGFYTSSNDGDTWTSIGWNNNGNIGNPIFYSIIRSGSTVVTSANSGVFLSTDNGNNWIKMDSGLIKNHTVLSFVVSGSTIFAGSTGGIFKLINNQTKWDSVNNGLTTKYITSLAIISTNIIAGTDNGMFLSSDSGANWIKTNWLWFANRQYY